MFPLIGLFGGALAGVLRYGQQRTGFDWETGLSIPSNPFGLALLALGLVCVVLSIVAGLGEPREATTLQEAFPGDTAMLCVMVAGIFLTIASGACMAYGAFGVSQMDLVVSLGVVFGGVGLLGIVPACRAGNEKKVDSVFALLSVVAAVVLLIVCYRQVSINPDLWAYGVEVLALAAVLMALFNLIGFSVSMGQPKEFSISATLAVVLCGAMMGNGLELGKTLYFAGNGLLLLGFLTAYCWGKQGDVSKAASQGEDQEESL